MTLKYRIAAIIIISLAFSLNVLAVKFYSVNKLFDLSIREVNSVCEDDNGFIWASSKTGILRVSKNSNHIYQLPYVTADAIKVKLAYKNFQLLAYASNGQVFSYNSIYDRFDFLLNLSEVLNSKDFLVFDILIDDTGICWISTSLGLYKYQSGKLSQVFNFLSRRYIISWYDSQNILLVKQDGIWIFNINSLDKKHIYERNDLGTLEIFSTYLENNKKRLWLGSVSDGLYLYEFDTGICSNVLKSDLPKQPILAIKENSDSTCLIGFDGQGIWELDRKNKMILNVYKESLDDTYSLRGNGVYDLYCDKNRRVWVCTYSGGLSFFDQASTVVNQIVHLVNNTNSLVNNDVNSIIEDKSGKIWFATNNGISCWNPISNKWRTFYSENGNHAQVFLTLCEDNQGRIWAGNYSSGVYLLDANTGNELAHYMKNEKGSPLVNGFIISIFKDSDGDCWLGGIGGSVICYLANKNDFRIYSEEPIVCFSELSKSQILLGCSNGLIVLNKKTGDLKTLFNGILVRDIKVIGDDIWICSGGGGLLKYNLKSGERKIFTVESGLPSNFINSVIYSDDYLWLGTENGLCRFDPEKEKIQTYSSIFSVSRVSFNISSRFILKNGQLAWGTNDGAVTFSPGLIKESSSNGKIYFQDLTIAGRSIRDINSFKLNTSIDSLKEVNLKYFQNTIALELISIGPSSGSKFSWKLEGFDQQWSPRTGNNVITYTNLPSGRFTLKIKLYDSSLTNVIDEHSVKLNLIPPFWRTIWFMILVIGFVTGVAILYFLYYINRLRQKHTEEKVRFFTNTAHDIRTSLTLINAPVMELNKETNLSESGKYYLHLAIQQARRLSSVTTQLMDFQKVDVGKEQLSLSIIDIVGLVSARRLMLDSFAKSNNIELVFHSDRERYNTAADELKMEKIIDNLISNAVKYSHRDSKVFIDLKCEDKKWVIKVIDHGIGINKKAQNQLFKEFYRAENAINSKVVGSGIGLLLVHNYVAMHGGVISCSSQENVGSTFQVVIPFIEKDKGIESVNLILNNDSTFTTELDIVKQPSASEKNICSKDMKILIVEDNDELRNFIHSVLRSEFVVSTADDGVKAWEIIRKQTPNMVISDVMMPNMDGFELCKLIKSTYETSHIPVILLTALSEKSEQLHGLGLGADDYLMKPFDMSLLRQRIKTILHNRSVVMEKAFKLIKGNTADPNILENELNDKFLKNILDVARTNISNSEFSKDEFASSVNMSSSLLYKKIKSLTGLSPTDFIKTIRLDHALELLQTRKYSVTEVSEISGFASVGYFSTVFRKHFGKSPTEILE